MKRSICTFRRIATVTICACRRIATVTFCTLAGSRS